MELSLAFDLHESVDVARVTGVLVAFDLAPITVQFNVMVAPRFHPCRTPLACVVRIILQPRGIVGIVNTDEHDVFRSCEAAAKYRFFKDHMSV